MSTLDRRALITGAAATALAGCDEATTKKLQARLNPSQTPGGAAPAATPAPTTAATAGAPGTALIVAAARRDSSTLVVRRGNIVGTASSQVVPVGALRRTPTGVSRWCVEPC